MAERAKKMGIPKAPTSPQNVKQQQTTQTTADHDASTSYGFHDSSLTDAASSPEDDRKISAAAAPAPAEIATPPRLPQDPKKKKKKKKESKKDIEDKAFKTKSSPKRAVVVDNEDDEDTFDATSSPSDRFRQDRPDHPSLRSSVARVESFKSHGLSELSKQVRIAHAKNRSQATEIDRLERQLRILADLKGVSVGDLRDALGRACAGEAHADLRTQINKLKAELDAAELIYGGKGGGSGKMGMVAGGDGHGKGGEVGEIDEGRGITAQHQAMVDGHDSAATIATNAQMFEKEASDKAIANLQLRVGELEEVETNLRTEIAGLYGKLQKQKATEATLTSKLASKEAQIEELLKSLQVADEEKERQRSEAKAAYANKQDESNAELSATLRLLEAAEAEALQYKSKASLLEESLRAAELQAKIKTDEANILHERLEARQKDLQLKTEQYQSRSAVQDERIRDLEQQLSSLYIAFGMVKEDFGEENQRRSVLEHYLADADTTVARQLNEQEGGGATAAGAPPATPVGAAVDAASVTPTAVAWRSGPLPVGSKVIVNTPEHSGKRGVIVSEVDDDSNGEQHVYLEESDETLSAPPSCLTPESAVVKTSRVINSPAPNGPPANPTSQVLASGFLLKRESKGLVKGWKRRYMVLRGSYGIYQLAWGESAGSKAKGSIGIATGVSSVTKTKQFQPSHKYAFVLYVNPNQPKAPILVACASSKADLEMWMKGLQYATLGLDPVQKTSIAPVDGSGHGNATTNQEMMDHQIAMRLQAQGTEFA